MLNKLQNIAHSRWYWLMLVAVGLSFIFVALYYQYELEQAPCVLCIQVRILMLCLTIVAFNALILNNRWAGRIAVSYTHLTLPTINGECRSRWSPYH